MPKGRVPKRREGRVPERRRALEPEAAGLERRRVAVAAVAVEGRRLRPNPGART